MKCNVICSLLQHLNLNLNLLFSHMSESAIVDIIASLMVLPNRMCIPLIDQVKVDEMKFPLPRVRLGMIVFHFQNQSKSFLCVCFQTGE